jgi:hypothetical protein
VYVSVLYTQYNVCRMYGMCSTVTPFHKVLAMHAVIMSYDIVRIYTYGYMQYHTFTRMLCFMYSSFMNAQQYLFALRKIYYLLSWGTLRVALYDCYT